jgi:hypothetical protein
VQNNLRFLGLSALFLASVCYAAPVYKVVGPDGQISYTDQPPPSSSARAVSTIRSGTPNNDDAAKPAGKVSVDRDPVFASLQVYFKQIIVESAKSICINLAAEYPPVQGAKEALADAMKAREKWWNRHIKLIEKKNVVLHDMLTREELLKVAKDAERENEPIVRKLQQAPAAERLSWCQNMPTTIAALEFDLARNTVLGETIMGYKPKRQP